MVCCLWHKCWGKLADTYDRRWIFRLNLPLSVLTGACIIFFMPLRPVEGSWIKKAKAVDYLGALLTLTGSTLIVVSGVVF